MTNQTITNEEEVAAYSIGAVVKLTGLSSHNIRVWERRHSAVVAKRLPSGRRCYSQAQVNRLLLLKRCIACGFSIRELAQLSDTELRNKVEYYKPKKKVSPKEGGITTVGIFSQSDLKAQIQKIPQIDITLSEVLNDFSTLHLNSSLLQASPNILLLEIPSIVVENVKSIAQLIKLTTPDLPIIIYRFGNQNHLKLLRNLGVRLLRAPLDDESLCNLLSGFISSNGWSAGNLYTPLPKQYPQHLYTQQQLSKITNLPTKVDCECPHHLVDILEGLKAFEKYSGECINKNDEDAALHGKIQLTTANARQQLEHLLREVLSIEGIEI